MLKLEGWITFGEAMIGTNYNSGFTRFYFIGLIIFVCKVITFGGFNDTKSKPFPDQLTFNHPLMVGNINSMNRII